MGEFGFSIVSGRLGLSVEWYLVTEDGKDEKTFSSPISQIYDSKGKFSGEFWNSRNEYAAASLWAPPGYHEMFVIVLLYSDGSLSNDKYNRMMLRLLPLPQSVGGRAW